LPEEMNQRTGSACQLFNEPHYAVTTEGHVLSFKYGKRRTLKPTPDSHGYLTVSVGGKLLRIHRLVALAFLPNPDDKEQVNHKDGNKMNNHRDNLEWCTSGENLKHALDTGLRVMPKGEGHHNSKLTWKDVRKIRKSKKTIGELMVIYGVASRTIRNVINKKTWKD